MLLGSVSLNLIYLATAIATAWLMLCVPLFLSWKKWRAQETEDGRLIREAVLGRPARDGMPAKDGLSEVLRQLGADVRTAIESDKEFRRRLDDHDRRSDAVDKRLDANDLALERIKGRMDERNK